MVYDEWSAVFRKDIFKEAMEKYISIRFLHRFAIVPGCGTNKTMIGPFVSSVEEGATVAVFQATQCFDTFHDILHGNPFAEILKQPITE